MDRVTAPPEGAIGPPVFTDGFGSRFLALDSEGGDPVEVLAFDPALVSAPYFAASVGVRVARLAGARHTLFARVRRIDRPSSDSLLLVSDRVAGWRLSHVLAVARQERLTLDISAVLNLMRQLIPAVALFGRHQRDLSIGTIAPERLILTPQGRLLIAEYVLGDAVEKLSLTRERSWRDYRVAVAVVPDAPREAQRSDVLGIGMVLLSLLLGRPLSDDEFPNALGDLLQQLTEVHGGSERPLSSRLSSWLARALQLDGHKTLASPKDAQVAFEEVLANERGYVTSGALLDDFVARFADLAGPPADIPKHVDEPPPVPREAALPPVEVAQHDPAMPAAALPSEQPSVPDTSPAAWTPQATADLVGETAPGGDIAPAPVQSAEVAAVDHVEPSREYAGLFDTRPSEAVATPAALAGPEARPEAASPEPAATVASAREATPGWMTKALAALALLAVLEAAVIAWLWNRSSDALLREGELAVQSRPIGARVLVDDDDVGVTPVSVRLAPGTYTLKVQVGDAEPRVIVVQIRAGVQTAQYLELQTGR